MNLVKRYVGIFFNIAVPLLVTAFIWFAGPKLLSFFMPFVVGLLIAMAAAPLVRFLERRVKLMRHFTSIVIIVGALALIVLLVWLVISRLIKEGIQFLADAPALLDAIGAELNLTLQKLEQLIQLLPDDVQQGIWTGVDNLSALVSDGMASLYSPTVAAAGSVARSIPNILVYTIVSLMSAYFFLADMEKLREQMRNRMPAFVMRVMNLIKQKSRQIVGSYFLAQFRIMFVIGVVLAIGLTILGVSYSGLVAFLIAVLDFLPIFGTGTVLLPWAVIKLFNGAYGAAVYLLLLYGITQLVRQLIQPKLIGDTMGMDPLMTLFLLYVGYRFQGFTGMILAVPVGMILLEAIRIGAYDSLIDGVKVLGQDLASLMRQARTKKQHSDSD